MTGLHRHGVLFAGDAIPPRRAGSLNLLTLRRKLGGRLEEGWRFSGVLLERPRISAWQAVDGLGGCSGG